MQEELPRPFLSLKRTCQKTCKEDLPASSIGCALPAEMALRRRMRAVIMMVSAQSAGVRRNSKGGRQMTGASRRTLKVGIFGIGLDTYWPQFPGLEARLKGNLAAVAKTLGRPDVEVINLGLVDTPQKALTAGHDFRSADVDLLFLYVT